MIDVYSPRPGFKFGCDPELFVRDETGRYVSAAGLIPGTKDNPERVEFGAVQVDGMAAEFNIDPVDNFDDFNRNIVKVMAQLKGFLPKGYTLEPISAVQFDPDVFDAAPDDAKALGCSPDWDAWSGEINMPPNDPENPYLRTASGHIHIGWTEDADLNDLQHIMNCRDLVKQLDWYLGGWSVQHDKDPTRRRLYGRAGACRFKDYGVEYRVLSNFWLTTKDKRLAVWNRLQLGIDAMQQQFMPDKVHEMNNFQLQDMINDTKGNPELMAAFRYPLISVMR